MATLHFQSGKETSASGRASFGAVIAAAKPYLAAVLIVTILLFIWIGLCAA
jgi:hypothetical protein